MASDSFIAENARRRANINKTRAATDMVPPPPPPPAPPQSAPKRQPVTKAVEEAAAQPNRQQLLSQIQKTLETARMAQTQRLLSSGSLLPPLGTRADMMRKAQRYQRMFAPRWT